MPEPLKNLYSAQLINTLCEQIVNQYVDFDADGFTKYVFDKEWENRELKERMVHISKSFRIFIPKKYSETLEILKAVSPKFDGFEYMFLPGFVELYGLDNYEDSIIALEHFTEYASSEFAVRPFIKQYKNKMMVQMNVWAESTNHHVRRLATEGCRPRLPWAMALPEFKKDPSLILPILEKLKNDESEYVRRSVANNLNDISKDNPDIVIEIARKWLGYSKELDWVTRHGCRTLLKQGHPEIMELFGFLKPEHIEIKDFTVQKLVEKGENIEFSFKLESKKQQLGKLRIEYVIDFMKKNGTQSRKVFKLSESQNQTNEKIINKSHSFKKISTRSYYAGIHSLAILVNGHELSCIEFLLIE